MYCKVCSKNAAIERTNQRYKTDPEFRKKFKIYGSKWQESIKDGYYYVYLLPKENYVGCTDNVYMRMSNHRVKNRDTSDYIILGRFKDRDEALRLETSYHDKGYAGKHPLNVYVRE